MKLNQKMALFLVAIFIIGFGSYFFLPNERDMSQDKDTLRIGAGDDITGVLLERIIEESASSDNSDLFKTQELEHFTFKDC